MKTSNKILLGTLGAAFFLFTSFLITLRANMIPIETIKGNGNITTEEIFMDNFTKIKNMTDFKVILSQGEKSIKVVTDENLQDAVIVEVEEGTLKIMTEGNRRIEQEGEFLIYVQSPTIESIYQKNSGIIEADSLVSGAQLTITAVDGGRIYLKKVNFPKITAYSNDSGFSYIEGETNTFTAKSSDAGRIHAENLKTKITKFNCRDAGHLRVNVTEVLSGEARDAGSVSYTGDPSLQVTQRDAGNIHKHE